MTESKGRWVLTGTAGIVNGRDFLLVGEEIVLGRTDENDIPVPEKNVSRRHLVIRPFRHFCAIRDLGSKNGTFVNSRPVEEAKIKESDVLRVGETTFSLRWEPSTEEGAEPNKPTGETKFGSPHEIVERIVEAFSGKGKIESRRLLLYGAGAILLLAAAWSSFRSPSPPKALPEEDAAITVPSTETIPPIKATDDEVTSWRRQADVAMQRVDLVAAIPLWKKILGARPDDIHAGAQLVRAQKRLHESIRTYYESGVREFEKLYYDRAIAEWRKVLVLAQDFDPETYARTTEKIREAEEKLKASR